MIKQTIFEKKLRKISRTTSFKTRKLVMDVNELIVSDLVAKEMRRSQLAAAIGRDKSFVSRMLNGSPNTTLKTLVMVADALGKDVSIQFVPQAMPAMKPVRETVMSMDQPAQPARIAGSYKRKSVVGSGEAVVVDMTVITDEQRREILNRMRAAASNAA